MYMYLVSGLKNKSSIIVGDFNALLSVIDRTSRLKKKISKGIENLNNTINQLDLIDI